MSPGWALVPYAGASPPAIHDTRAAGRSVTAWTASVGGDSGANNWDDGEKSRDQNGSHFSLHHERL